MIDDTSRSRSRNTKTLPSVHKVFDKKTSGYLQGQQLVFLVLTTKVATFPIDFRFYEPDPELPKWKQNNKKLKCQKIPKNKCPKAPLLNQVEYPTMQQLGRMEPTSSLAYCV